MEYKNIRKKFYMKVIEILNGFRISRGKWRENDIRRITYVELMEVSFGSQIRVI